MDYGPEAEAASLLRLLTTAALIQLGNVLIPLLDREGRRLSASAIFLEAVFRFPDKVDGGIAFVK